MNSLQVGEAVRHRFRVEALAGEGAQAAVYRVRDVNVADAVWALKELRTDGLSDAERVEAVELFSREARFLCGLGHPGFPRVVDFFEWGGSHYQVMEYVAGRTLDAMVEEDGPLSEAALLPIARELASHLAFLHGHPTGPIVYRDLKPSNVMVGADGRVTLLDFGIARVYKPWQLIDTQPLGTPGFAAPEQYGAGQSSPASDVYALAATLYFCLTGAEPPPPGKPRPPLRKLAPRCSAVMERLLAGCLRERAAERPASAAEVVSLLDVVADLWGGGWPAALCGMRSTLARDGELLWHWMGAMLQPRAVEFAHWGKLLELFGIIALVSLLAAAMVPNVIIRTHSGSPITGCKSNLKNIGTALEMYSTDNHGRFPTALSKLTPNYLKIIPTCPVTGIDTYTSGYAHAAHPDAYTVVCSGRNHGDVGLAANYPQYTSTEGLIER